MHLAQHQHSGVIKDKANNVPISFSTAALLRPDSSVLTGEMTDDKGKFVIKNVDPDEYLLQASFLGYEKEYRRLLRFIHI